MNDFPITKHFSFYELTRTNHFDLLELNRSEAMAHLTQMTTMAELMEKVREMAKAPIEVHSCFRTKALNDAVGSTDKSQHLTGSACDYSLVGPDTEESLRELYNLVIAGLLGENIPFGQVIREEAGRGFSKVRWLHTSLGSKGEVMRMKDGVFEHIATV